MTRARLWTWARSLLCGGVTVTVLAGCYVGDTGGATVVSDTRATVHGTVHRTESNNPGVEWFEYGTTSAYGSSTAQRQSYGEATAVLDGLEPGTTYHYRLCARDTTDGLGVCGADRTVTTSVGREAIWGGAGSSWSCPLPSSPPSCNSSMFVDAVGDPTTGFVEGTAGQSGVVFVPPGHLVPWGGSGNVSCLAVEGNIAVAGFAYNDQLLGLQLVTLIVQDNGPTGDRVIVTSAYDGNCPDPDPSLITGGQTGDFVVDDD